VRWPAAISIGARRPAAISLGVAAGRPTSQLDALRTFADSARVASRGVVQLLHLAPLLDGLADIIAPADYPHAGSNNLIVDLAGWPMGAGPKG